MLHGFENTDGFIQLLGKHEIRIWKNDLEEYEREGWLQPAFRLVLPEDQRQGDVDLYLGTDAIQQYYAGRAHGVSTGGGLRAMEQIQGRA